MFISRARGWSLPTQHRIRRSRRGRRRRVLPLVDVLTPSVDDVRSLLGPVAAGLDVARLLVGMGAAVVMVTGGRAGARLCTAGSERLAAAGTVVACLPARRSHCDISAPAPNVRVRTTVGTGDVATAGLLHGLLTGLDPQPSLDLAMLTAGRTLAGLPLRAPDPDPAANRA